MVTKWFRENVWAAVAVTFVRVFLGWLWLDAGWHKLTGGFDATGFLKGAIAKPVADHATQAVIFPNYTYFIEHFALPNVKIINFLIPVGETLIGIGLIVGGLAATAAFFGIMLNLMFMFAGTVSTNPWLLTLGFIVFTAGANAGRFGLDYYLMPLLRKGWTKIRAGHGKKDNTDHRGIGGKILPH